MTVTYTHPDVLTRAAALARKPLNVKRSSPRTKPKRTAFRVPARPC
jgi:hypothetical protein